MTFGRSSSHAMILISAARAKTKKGSPACQKSRPVGFGIYADSLICSSFSKCGGVES